MAENDDRKIETTVRISPIKFTIEKNGIEYEFEPIGDVTDLAKLKQDIADILKRFKITVKTKDSIVIPKLTPESRESFDECYVKAKDMIRTWYKENPTKEWSANDLTEAIKCEKGKRSAIMAKLRTEKFIKCVNPEEAKNKRKYLKAEAMITPEATEKRDMDKLLQERRLVLEG